MTWPSAVCCGSSFRLETVDQVADFLGRIDRHHADRVIAAIDVVHLAGDAAAQVGQEIEPGVADVVERHVALER